MKKSNKIMRKFAYLAVLTVIVVLLQLLGSAIRIGEFSISLILLPVVAGAVLCGPWGGAWLGCVFGTTLILMGETDVFFAISPIYTIISTAIRGALAGLASSLVYLAVNKKKEDFAVVLASITAPIVNTCLFIICSLLFFYDVFESLMGSGNVVKGLITSYVSINFLIELALNMVLAPLLIRLVKYLDKSNNKSEIYDKNNRKKLATRLTIAVILLGIFICTVSSNSGYSNFTKTMKTQYNNTAYQIAETANTYLDTELIQEYKEVLNSGITDETATVLRSESYNETLDKLASLSNSMGANEIYVAVADVDILASITDDNINKDQTPLKYIFACGDISEKSFGDNGTINPEFASIIADSLKSHQRPESYLITSSEGSDSLSAVQGIYDPNTDELLAIIVVTIPMDALENAVRNDITDSTVMMISIEVIFITLYFYYISYRVIEPIRTISGEVSGFVKNQGSTGDSVKKINTRDEIQQLAEDIVKMERDIGSYIEDITTITAEKERIETELSVAAKIQLDMLPSVFPEREDIDIFASMNPAKEVGGDFYDFFLLDNDHIALVIGDVSGKGVPAALFMVIAKTLIKNQTSFSRSPKEILEAVNNQLWENNRSRMFVTVWLGILEISTGRCVAANAGHEYPVIRQANGEFELFKDIHGFVLGGIKNSKYNEYEFTLEKGGSIFVYTDGIPEAENTEEELFGMERMISALNIDSSASPTEIIQNMQMTTRDYIGNADQFDDITMLCIKRN